MQIIRPVLLIFTVLWLLPFDRAAADIDFAEVKKFAMFSEASYFTSRTMGGIAKNYHYELIKHGTIRDAQVQYFLLRHKTSDKQLIVVRGTDNVENVVLDAAIKLVEDAHTGIVLHEGFAYAARAVLQAINKDLNKKQAIDVTGHSLGGAVAVIIGMYLDRDLYQVEHVYTYGQPKVTNIPGSVKYAHLNILRFVTPGDLVPLVPPLDPMDLDNIDIYWHVGEEVVLLPGKRYSRIGVLNSMLRATKILTNKLSEKNLEQHQMITYLDAIRDKVEGAELVPYESTLSLKKLMDLF